MARKQIKLALEAYDMQGNKTNDIRPGERAFLKLMNGHCVLTSPVQSVIVPEGFVLQKTNEAS